MIQTPHTSTPWFCVNLKHKTKAYSQSIWKCKYTNTHRHTHGNVENDMPLCVLTTGSASTMVSVVTTSLSLATVSLFLSLPMTQAVSGITPSFTHYPQYIVQRCIVAPLLQSRTPAVATSIFKRALYQANTGLRQMHRYCIIWYKVVFLCKWTQCLNRNTFTLETNTQLYIHNIILYFNSYKKQFEVSKVVRGFL